MRIRNWPKFLFRAWVFSGLLFVGSCGVSVGGALISFWVEPSIPYVFMTLGAFIAVLAISAVFFLLLFGGTGVALHNAIKLDKVIEKTDRVDDIEQALGEISQAKTYVNKSAKEDKEY